MSVIARLLTPTLTLLVLVGPARAGFTLRFDRPDYTVQVGGTVDVQVYLQETVLPGEPSLLETEGLIGAGVRVTFDNDPLPADPAQVLSVLDIAPNPGFDDAFGPTLEVVPGESAGFSAVVDVASPPVYGTMVAPLAFELLLGTFRFTAGSVPGEVTRIRAVDFSDLDETVTAESGTVLDGFGEAEATITVTPVPEPSGLLLCCLGLATLCLARSRMPLSGSPTPAGGSSGSGYPGRCRTC